MSSGGIGRAPDEASNRRPSARKARSWMAFGFVTSFAGSTLVLGSVTGFVVLGVLPVVWIPIYRSLESIEDLAAPLVARLTRSIPAAKLLISVEIFDLAATTVAIVALFVDPSDARFVFVAYLVLTSLGPLILDLAEEYFANDIAQYAPADTLKLNAAVYSAIGLFSGLLSRPIGSLLAAGPVSLVLWINAALTIMGLAMRLRALHLYGSATDGYARPTADTLSSERPSTSIVAKPSSGRLILDRLLISTASTLISPAISFMLALASGLIGTYLVLWLADTSTGRLAAGLAAAGIGGTLGPQVSRVARGAHDPRDYPTTLRLFCGLMLMSLVGVVVTALVASRGSIFVTATGCLWLVMYGIGASGFIVLLSSYRQASLDRPAFARVIGWVHGASAAGALVGSWVGIALKAQQSPVRAALLSILVLCVVGLSLERAIRSSAKLSPG